MNNTKLKNLCISITDCPHSTPLWTDKGRLVLRNFNIKKGHLDFSSVFYTDDDHYFTRIRRNRPESGDIVITREAPMGEACIIPAGFECCLGQRMVLLKSNTNLVVSKYLLYALLSDFVQLQIKLNGGTGTTVSNLRIPYLENLSIPIPPLPEQQKIADILSTVDEHISETESLIEKTKVLKQGMMQRLLTKGIGHTEFKDTEIGRIPVEWEVVNTEAILFSAKGSLKIGPFGSQLRKEFLQESGPFRVYGQENIFNNDFIIGKRYLSKSMYEKLESCKIQSGDILISMMGTIGKCSIVPSSIAPGIMDSHLIRLRVDDQKADKPYVKYLVAESSLIQKQIKQLSVGGIMDGLSSGIIKQLLFPLPPLPEQQKIASILTSIDDQIDSHLIKLTAQTKLKSALMQQLLTGKTRVKI